MAMFDTVPDFDWSPSTSPKSSILMCDVPFLEGASHDLPFRAHNADVPDDLLACTPIHGWDTPPDSPVHNQVLDGFSDPLISTKVGMLFDSMEEPMDFSVKDESCEPAFEWTPPASPVPSSGCDDFISAFSSDLDDLGTPFDQIDPASGTPKNLKRKSSAADKEERKRSRQKLEVERVQRTEECDKAVKELANGKTDDDPESRRHTHNVLERKRRNDLKNSYQQLREQLPTLEDNERAPTGQILLAAVDFVRLLKKDEVDIGVSLTAARAENERLKKLLGRKF